MEPKVSIIIPCYNQEHVIEETLKSVFLQSYENWECIIIDDGSIDDSVTICNAWVEKDKRFKYFFKNNGGLSSSRNYGIEKSTGDFFQFLDSDDLIEHNKIYEDVKALLTKPDYDVVYSFPKFFKSNNLFFDKYPDGFLMNRSFKKFEIMPFLIENNFTVVSSPLIKKEIVFKIGLFDQNLKSNEDWDYWLRLAMTGAQILFREALENSSTLIRVSEGSMSTNYYRMLASEIEMRKKIKLNDLNNKLVKLNDLNIIKCEILSKGLCKSRNIIVKFFKEYGYNFSIFIYLIKYSLIKIKNNI